MKMNIAIAMVLVASVLATMCILKDKDIKELNSDLSEMSYAVLERDRQIEQLNDDVIILREEVKDMRQELQELPKVQFR